VPAVIGVYQLQRPDLGTEDLHGDRQVRRRLGHFDDLDHRAMS